ncbi:MAG: hypothetical protein Q7T56_19670 [Nocardioidaceae bacterium]|nr:hypothetical protein [Nocardioidaceae bacterium]
MTTAEFWQGALLGTPLGAGLTLLTVVTLRRQQKPIEYERLTEADHTALTDEFATHAEAMQRQVSEYADSLAAGDLVLRERLRRFEVDGQ